MNTLDYIVKKFNVDLAKESLLFVNLTKVVPAWSCIRNSSMVCFRPTGSRGLDVGKNTKPTTRIMKDQDLTVIFYTANVLHEPFAGTVRKQLLKAKGDYPLISVSQKPMDFGINICVGDIGRSHLNIYRQILIGCKAAQTKYVAMTEDDALYSYEHFHNFRPSAGKFAYDMNKWSIFTWIKPPAFFYRYRKVVNSLIAERQMLIDALEERFKKVEELMALGKKEEEIISRWGDPGRYERNLRVTRRPSEECTTSVPSIIFNHEEAFGFTSLGKRKKLGDQKADELPGWGKAQDIVKFWFEK